MTKSAQPAKFAQPGPGLVPGEWVLVADGAVGTMLQASDISLDGFDGHEGCTEILNVTRPDVEQSTDALIAFQPEARYFPA